MSQIICMCVLPVSIVMIHVGSSQKQANNFVVFRKAFRFASKQKNIFVT